jgi:hypothetical protein
MPKGEKEANEKSEEESVVRRVSKNPKDRLHARYHKRKRDLTKKNQAP